MNAKRAGIALAIALMFAAASPASRAEVIGKTKTPLDGRQARKAECTLGDLAADAARAAVKADLALVQAGQLRAVVIPAGDLDDAQLASALVYPDEKVVLVEISGKKLRAALERGLSSLPQPGIGFLQVSGLQVKFRSQSQANHRIEAVLQRPPGEADRPGASAGGAGLRKRAGRTRSPRGKAAGGPVAREGEMTAPGPAETALPWDEFASRRHHYSASGNG